MTTKAAMENYTLRLLPVERSELERAAELARVSPAAFARFAIVEATQRALGTEPIKPGA